MTAKHWRHSNKHNLKCTRRSNRKFFFPLVKQKQTKPSSATYDRTQQHQQIKIDKKVKRLLLISMYEYADGGKSLNFQQNTELWFEKNMCVSWQKILESLLANVIQINDLFVPGIKGSCQANTRRQARMITKRYRAQ